MPVESAATAPSAISVECKVTSTSSKGAKPPAVSSTVSPELSVGSVVNGDPSGPMAATLGVPAGLVDVGVLLDVVEPLAALKVGAVEDPETEGLDPEVLGAAVVGAVVDDPLLEAVGVGADVVGADVVGVGVGVGVTVTVGVGVGVGSDPAGV
jgi:hypothetical protein